MSRLKAVIFDWAGTMIDFGSFAPMGVFVEAFRRFGVDVSITEARIPMGLPKWMHIQAMVMIPRVAEAWEAVHGARPTDADVDRIYEVFLPLNEAVVVDYATLVPGAKETIDWLAERKIKVGSTTGYTRSIMERVAPKAAEQGYTPLNMVCADDLVEGRPGPLGMYQCFIDLQVYPPSSVLKVDDTPPGIAEGVAAGCPTVGLLLSGNIAGRTPEEIAVLDAESLNAIRGDATKALKEAGADHVIDTVADLPALIEKIWP